MSNALDVTTATFETEVIAASMQLPVVVDFWAPWCGPCQSLGPILDKLAVEFDGRIKVVKVNTDEEMQLASIFGIRSLPTVMLLKDGQPVDGFMGLQPESAVRQWLSPHIGPHDGVTTDGADEGLIDLEDGVAAVPPVEALATARKQLAANPDSVEWKLALIDALVAVGELDEAQLRLDELPAADGESDRARAARAALQFHYVAERAPPVAELDERLHRDPDDHEARHLLGVRLLLDADHAAGLDAFLELMKRSRAYGDDLGRKSLVQAFLLVRDDELVARTRRAMSALLF